MALLVLASQALTAQVQPGAQVGQGGFQNFGPGDTTQRDSQRQVTRRLARRSADALWQATWHDDTTDLPLTAVHVWDGADTLPGWRQTLGQVGKPYLNFRYGLPSYLLPSRVYRNPLSGQDEVYIPDPHHQLVHFDTRTPYVEGFFQQAAQRSQFFSATVTQNITPYWNVAVGYTRRTSDGQYTRMRTDQTHINLTLTHKGYSKRLVLLGSASFNQMSDQLSGGVQFDPLADDLDELYEGLLAPSVLASASYRRKVRHLLGVGRYRLLGDSLRNLTLVAEAGYQDYLREYFDPQGISASQDTLYQRPYGQVFTSDTVTQDVYLVRQTHLKAGLQGAVRIFGVQALAVGDIALERSTYYQELAAGQVLDQQRTTLGGLLALRDTSAQQGLRLDIRTEFTFSNRFASEQRLHARGSYRSQQIRYALPDSVPVRRFARWVSQPLTLTGAYVPWAIELELLLHNRNPSVFQALWTSALRESRALGNEQIGLLRVGVVRTGGPSTRGGVPYEPNRISLTGFTSAQVQPVVWGLDGQGYQSANTTPLQWYGVELGARGRWGRWYAEGSLTAQVAPDHPDSVLARHQAAQPRLYGTFDVYYYGKPFREAWARFRMGVAGRYFTAFEPLSFDAGNQTFYPNLRYQQPAYLRLDAYVESQVSTDAQVFFRWQFVNNLFLASQFLGYLTTPYYPEWPAALTWGVRYRFFD